MFKGGTLPANDTWLNPQKRTHCEQSLQTQRALEQNAPGNSESVTVDQPIKTRSRQVTDRPARSTTMLLRCSISDQHVLARGHRTANSRTVSREDKNRCCHCLRAHWRAGQPRRRAGLVRTYSHYRPTTARALQNKKWRNGLQIASAEQCFFIDHENGKIAVTKEFQGQKSVCNCE